MTPNTPRARAPRRLLAALAAAVFTALSGAIVAPAYAAVEEQPEPELILASSVRGVAHAGAALSASLQIANAGNEPLPASTAVLQLGTRPLADRSALRSWLAGLDPDLPLTSIGSTAGSAVAADGSTEVSLTAPAETPALAALTPGVYPLQATYGGATAQSVIVVGAEAEPTSLILPITAPVENAGLLSADELASLTAPDGALTAQLSAAAGTPAALAVDPAIPAAIRVLGEDAPLSAIEWLERLMLLPNDRFALQFGDADVAPQLQAGLPAPLSPLSLEGYEAAAEPEPTPTPTPTPTEKPAAVGSDEEDLDLARLLSIGDDAIDSVYWPAPGQATPAVMDALRAANPDAIAVTPSEATQEGASGSAVPASGAIAGGGAALVYDTDASAALDAVVRAATAAERSAASAVATAELFFAGREAGDAPVLVALDRALSTRLSMAEEGEAGDAALDDLADRLSAAIDLVALTSTIAPQHLDDVLAAPAQPITPVDATPDAARVALAASIADAESRVGVIATVLETPAMLNGLQRAEALQALGVGWAARTDEWQAVATGFADRTAARADAVAIQEPAPVNLLSAGVNLPVWVRNDLPWPATLTLRASPSDPRLVVADTTSVVAQPASRTQVQVPVQARVGSGDVDIALTLISRDGHRIGPSQTVDVSVRAEWETIGVIVLGVLIGGLLVAGVIRTVRRRRKTKDPDAAARADDDVTEGDA
ncbi:DUF6049 family protein [Microbacterium stercoris]|uniref:2-oxoglutarate dehydrogenase n=1 Tax=Microbacterium stercoris TaxID=2820289 RepID=A0A939TLA2_9MICO|nr:DUF6049 family protein [Microbacterium stercoris]MBO3661918.1 2-oxoglutarate dehydrogenase [Microbacterium stercoris]